MQNWEITFLARGRWRARKNELTAARSTRTQGLRFDADSELRQKQRGGKLNKQKETQFVEPGIRPIVSPIR